jgi:signal transduction histidine kinase
MLTSTSYGKKLFTYFLTVFIVFTVILITIQYSRDKTFRARELESMLDTYCEFSNSFIKNRGNDGSFDFSTLDSLVKIFPRTDIRITIVDFAGRVLFDSEHSSFQEMANHIGRPEIQDALLYNKGSDIRLSESVNRTFYYFAKKYDDYFIRAAVVYSTGIQTLLSGRSLFWLIVAFLFFAAASVLFFLSNNFGKAIVKLKEFSENAANNKKIDDSFHFPENELGFIGEQIVTVYRKLENSNKELVNEKEKLVRHLQLSQEGVAFFSKDGREILSNNHFLNFLNVISDNQVSEPGEFREVKELEPVCRFLESQLGSEQNLNPSQKISIEKNNRFFDVQCFIFQDHSYEVSIIDITSSIKEKMLKHEMTSNIAHELRTPVSSIKGYLETILRDPNITEEKKHYFIERAASQTDRLADLIRDIAMITQIEEASNLYKLETINLASILNDAIESLESEIKDVNAKVEVNINRETNIFGNRALTFSIFRNLLENSLNYGGRDITISIDEFLDREDLMFYSFSDNGRGIDPIHQHRVFERFYRVDEGRARNEGGTGLGLAIVKNAVLFHGGEIFVKNRKGGGVEFWFSLKKQNTNGKN